MQIVRTCQALAELKAQRLQQGQSLGFVPTMGALHEGHLELLRVAKAEHSLSLCSIFVNPTQFNDPRDLALYPRPIEADIALLEGLGCDVLFLPEVEEIYPPEGLPPFEPDLAGLDRLWEGAQRPGHFAGVVQVVKRLLDLVQPDTLYLGQKDFQQYSIVKRMLGFMPAPPRLVCVPIVREPHGLAMSSRNVRLSASARQDAAVIYQALQGLQQGVLSLGLEAALAQAQAQIQTQGFEVLYLCVAEPDTLQAIDNQEYLPSKAIALAAVQVEGIRLLDNHWLYF